MGRKFGHIVTEETKEKISLSLKGKRRNPATEFKKGSIPWNKGIHIRINTGRTCFKKGTDIGTKALNKWRKNGGKTWCEGIKLGLMTKEQRNKISFKLKGRTPKNFDKLLENMRHRIPTGIEIKVYEELQKRGFLFEKQRRMGNKYVVDAFIPLLNLIIEVDGSYWHSLPKVVNRDLIRDDFFIKSGYSILRLKETEINNGNFLNKLPKKNG